MTPSLLGWGPREVRVGCGRCPRMSRDNRCVRWEHRPPAGLGEARQAPAGQLGVLRARARGSRTAGLGLSGPRETIVSGDLPPFSKILPSGFCLHQHDHSVEDTSPREAGRLGTVTSTPR